MGKNTNRWVSKDKIKEMFGVSDCFLNNQVKRGNINCCRPEGTNVMFFDPLEIDQWIGKGKLL